MRKTEPAALAALIGALVAAAAQALEAAQTGNGFNWWAAIAVGVPLAVGAFTRAKVVAVETVRSTIKVATSASAAVSSLANRVALEVEDRPPFGS